MKTAHIPWGAWHGDGDFELTFPDSWEVELAPMRDAPDVGEEELRAAFRMPIGTPRLRELARGKGRVAIAIDDISRPTPASRLMPLIWEELEAGGIKPEQVVLIFAVAAHRFHAREDSLKKAGEWAIQTFETHSHHCYENLVDLGKTSFGTPVFLNRFFAEADLRIGVGSVTPHGGPGFGGGAKIVLPGVVGIETITANHGGHLKGGRGLMEGNELRADMEEAARMARLDVIVNCVLTMRRGIAGLFVGDMVAAHREGVKLARQVYGTPLPEPADVVVFNAYPEDTELVQAGKGLGVGARVGKRLLRVGGSVVLTAACSEGRGIHSHGQPYMHTNRPRGMRPTFNPVGKSIGFSPNLSAPDFYFNYSKEVLFFNRWEEVRAELERTHGPGCRVVVFPCGSIQIAETGN